MFNQRLNFAALPAIFTTSRHWFVILRAFKLGMFFDFNCFVVP